MDVYSHITDGMQNDAMALLDEALPVGVNDKVLSLLFKGLAINASLAQW